MYSTKRTWPMAAALLAMMTAGAGRMAAQGAPQAASGPPSGQVPVTLILVSNGASPGVLRRSGSGPRNVILLDSASVDIQQLSDAVFGLLVMEARDSAGSKRSDSEVARFRLDKPHPVYAWAAATLDQLRTAPKGAIPGVGQGRWLEIHVTPLRGHSR